MCLGLVLVLLLVKVVSINIRIVNTNFVVDLCGYYPTNTTNYVSLSACGREYPLLRYEPWLGIVEDESGVAAPGIADEAGKLHVTS